MAWTNGPLVLYHGCDDGSARSIANSGINLSLCAKLTDFGQGFYTTTNLVQAKNWANERCRRLSLASGTMPTAAVVQFDVDRDQLARLEFLAFITENSNNDFWDLIFRCRQTLPPGQHNRSINTEYDVVCGPVTLWPQTLVIKDCDQISFHTPSGLGCLSTIAIPFLGTPLFP